MYLQFNKDWITKYGDNLCPRRGEFTLSIDQCVNIFGSEDVVALGFSGGITPEMWVKADKLYEEWLELNKKS